MNMTGHAKESTFMGYIGRDPDRDSYADAFMEGLKQLWLKIKVHPQIEISHGSRFVVSFAVGVDSDVVKIGPVEQVVDASKKREGIKGLPYS